MIRHIVMNYDFVGLHPTHLTLDSTNPLLDKPELFPLFSRVTHLDCYSHLDIRVSPYHLMPCLTHLALPFQGRPWDGNSEEKAVEIIEACERLELLLFLVRDEEAMKRAMKKRSTKTQKLIFDVAQSQMERWEDALEGMNVWERALGNASP